MELKRVDLHVHSTHSDGYFSLKSLFDMAARVELDLFSITDHDTISSQKEAITLAKELNINYLTGVEISCHFYSQTVHIVGLDIDIENPKLNYSLTKLHNIRKIRAEKIASKIEKHTSLTDVLKRLQRDDNQSYCRLHFAELLVDHLYAKDSYKAFNQFLKEDAPCYAPAHWIEMKEAIKVIHSAGGKVVLAHPLKYKMSSSKLKFLFKKFKEFGGNAVEVISGRDRNKARINKVANLANRFDLAISCGSDFHHRFSQRIGVDTNLIPQLSKSRVWDIKNDNK